MIYIFFFLPQSQNRDSEDSWRPIVGTSPTNLELERSSNQFTSRSGAHPVFNKLLEHESRNIETYDTSLHNKFYSHLKSLNDDDNRQVPFRTQQQGYLTSENDFLRSLLKNQNGLPHNNNQNRSPTPFESANIHRTIDPYEAQFSNQFVQPNNRYPLDFIAPPQRGDQGSFRNQDFIGAVGSPIRKVEPTAAANEIPDTSVPQSFHLSNLVSSKDTGEFPGQKKIKIFLSSQPIYTTPKNLQTYSSTKNFIHDLSGGKYTTAILRPNGNKQLEASDLLKSFSHVRPFNDYYIPNVPPAKISNNKGHHGKKKGDPNQIRYQQEHQKQNNYQEIQKFLNQGFNAQGGGHKHINLGNISWYQQQQLQNYQQQQKQKQQQHLLQQLQQQNFELQKYLGNNGNNNQQAYGVPKVIPITRIPNIQGHYDSSPVIVTKPKQENPNVGKEVFNQFANLGRPFDYNIKPLTNVQPKPFHKPTVVPPPESVNILGNSIVQTHFQYGVPELQTNTNYQQFSIRLPAEPPRDVVQGKPYPNIKPIAPPELQQDQKRRPEFIKQEIDEYLERPETLSQSEEIALKEQNIDIYRKQNQGNRNQGYNDNKRHPPNNNQGNYHGANVNNPNNIAQDIIGQIVKQATNNNRFRQNNADEVKLQQDISGINNQYHDNAPKFRNKFKNKPVIPVVEKRPEAVTNYPDDAFLSSFQDFLSEYNTKRPAPPVYSSTVANEYKKPEPEVKYGFTDTMPSSTQNPAYEGGFRPIKNKDNYQQTPDFTEIYNPTTVLYNTEPNVFQFSNNEVIDKLPPVLEYTPNPQLELKPPKETYTPHVEIFGNNDNSISRPNIENVNPNIQVNTPNDVGIIYQTKKPSFLPTPTYEAITNPPPAIVTNPPAVETSTNLARPEFPRKKLKRRRKPGKHRQRYPQGQEDQERRPTEKSDGEGTTLEYENPTQTYTYDYQTNLPVTTLPSVTEVFNRPTTLPTTTPGAPSSSTTTTENSRLRNRSKYNGTRSNRPRFSIKDLKTSTTTTTDKPQTTLDENDITTTQASKFKIRYRQPSKYATKTPLTENPLLLLETTTTPRPKWKPPSTPSRYKSRFRISTSTTQVTSPPSTEEDKEVSASVKIKQKIDLISKRNQNRHKPLQEIKDNASAEEETPKEPEMSKEPPKKIKNIYSSQRRHPYLLNKKQVTPATQDHNTLDDQMPSPSSAEEIVDKLQYLDTTLPSTKEEVVKNEPANENLGVLSSNPHEINEFINSAETPDDDRSKHRGSSHGIEENPHAYFNDADREKHDDTRVYANDEPTEHDYILPIIRHYSNEKYSNHKLDKEPQRVEPGRKSVHENIKDIISSEKSKDYKDEDAPPNLTIVKAPWDDLSSMFDDINVQSNGHSQKPYSTSMRDNAVTSSLTPPLKVFSDPVSSAVPAKKKISSKISFTTDNPILPIEAFFQFSKRDDEK